MSPRSWPFRCAMRSRRCAGAHPSGRTCPAPPLKSRNVVSSFKPTILCGFFRFARRADIQQGPGAIYGKSYPALVLLTVRLVEYSHRTWIEKHRGGPLN